MFFNDCDKLIYKSPTGRDYDPLAVHRQLTVASGGLLNDWLAAWTAADAGVVDKAQAESLLVAAARAAFGLKPFDADGGVLDGVALDCLRDYLEWLEGNGRRGPTASA